MKKLYFLAALISPAICFAQHNPIIHTQYSADPSARVFGDTLYLYPSHDRDDSKTFDIRVVKTESGIDLICKDAGRPFNPVIDFDTDAATAVQKGEKAMLSLRVFNYYASNPEYKRLHCVNFTRLSFPIGVAL